MTKRLFLHIIVSLLALIPILLINLFFELSSTAVGIKTLYASLSFAFSLLFFLLMLMPTTLFSIYILYRYLSRRKSVATLQKLVTPLVGISIPPLVFYWSAITNDDRWHGFGAVMTGFIGLLIYVANECLLFWTSRKK
ncbi:hypothetical protein KJ657_01460 [Patescibacteria group bacterium]|nr:hypothetical protein [Patescibacteria group bacterium]MBU1015736.1 hypothetical protein [Patescibacteria group bacterium]